MSTPSPYYSPETTPVQRQIQAPSQLQYDSPSASRQLEQIWTSVKCRLYAILDNMKGVPIRTRASDWVEIYTNFSTLYSNKPDSLKRRAFSYVRSFILELVENQLQDLRHLQDLPLLSEYIRRWETTFEFVRFMKRVLHHLHRFWIWDNANNLKNDPVRPIDKLLMFYWRENLLTHLHSVVDVALRLVEKDRCGHKVDRSLIRGLVDNLVILGSADVYAPPDPRTTSSISARPSSLVSSSAIAAATSSSSSPSSSSPSSTAPSSSLYAQCHSTLNLYHQLFEEPFIAETVAYYKSNNSRVDPDDFSAFMKHVFSQLEDEENRARDLLHEDSIVRVRQAAQDQLIGNQLEYLQTQISNMIRDGRHDDLHTVYSLLRRIDNGIGPVRSFFIHHIRAEGNSIVVQHVSNLNGSNKATDSLILIEKMVQLNLKYSSMVRRCFDNSPIMLAAVDDAFRGFVNRSTGNLSLPTVLAYYMDNLLQYEQKSVPSALTSAAIAVGLSKRRNENDSLAGNKSDHDNEQEDDEDYNINNKINNDSDDDITSTPRRHNNPPNHQSNDDVNISNENVIGDGIGQSGDATGYKQNAMDDIDNDSVIDELHGDGTPEMKYLSELVRFFMYLDDKDVFCEAHGRLFATRLLSKYNEQLESEFIARLERRMGGIYTRRYRGMMSDIQTSAALAPAFKKYLTEKRDALIASNSMKNNNKSNHNNNNNENQTKSTTIDRNATMMTIIQTNKSRNDGTTVAINATAAAVNNDDDVRPVENNQNNEVNRGRGGGGHDESSLNEVKPSDQTPNDPDATQIRDSDAIIPVYPEQQQQQIGNTNEEKNDSDDVGNTGTNNNDDENIVAGAGAAVAAAAREMKDEEENRNKASTAGGPSSSAAAAASNSNVNVNQGVNNNGVIDVDAEPQQAMPNAPHPNEVLNVDGEAEVDAGAGAVAGHMFAAQPVYVEGLEHNAPIPVAVPVPVEQHGNDDDVRFRVPVRIVAEGGEVEEEEEEKQQEQDKKTNGVEQVAERELSQLDTSIVSSALSMDISVRVLNGLHWPTEKCEVVRSPPILRACHALFTGYYMKDRAWRTLTWLDRISTVTLQANLNRGSHTVVTCAAQACVLLLFSDHSVDTLSVKEIARQLDVSIEEVGRLLRPLVSSKQCGLLRFTLPTEQQQEEQKQQLKEEREREKREELKMSSMPCRKRKRRISATSMEYHENEDKKTKNMNVNNESWNGSTDLSNSNNSNNNNMIENGTTSNNNINDEKIDVQQLGARLVRVNDKFDRSSSVTQVVIPMSTVQIASADVEKTRKSVIVDRNMQVDAAIVRTMKSKKEASHVELCDEVIRVLSNTFLPDPRLIKLRIDRLIDMEYVTRHPEDMKTYRYGP